MFLFIEKCDFDEESLFMSQHYTKLIAKFL